MSITEKLELPSKYFAFGAAAREYHETGSITSLEDGDIFEYNPNEINEPNLLLAASEGFDGYAEITEGEYLEALLIRN